jgi:hypothetical protein
MMRRRLLVALLALACTGAEPAPPAQSPTPAAAPAATQPSMESPANEMSDTSGARAVFAALGFCGDDTELVALRCAHVPSTRRGDTLILGVLQGAPAVRANYGEESTSRYAGRLASRDGAGFHVVWAHGGDNNAVELIAERSGDTLTLVDYPHVSPDSTRFVVVATSYETCEGVAQIDAWSLNARPAREFTVQTFDCTRNLGWWATDVVWRSADSVSFVRRSLPGDAAPGWLARRAATWVLDTASATAIPRYPTDSL